MSSGYHYEAFRHALDKLPLPALVEFAELERKMIEDDFSNHKTPLLEEDFSIINFCRFIEAVAKGSAMPSCIVPFEHEQYYRQIVQKLVAFHELPVYALKQFDAAFSPVFQQEEVAA